MSDPVTKPVQLATQVVVVVAAAARMLPSAAVHGDVNS